MSDLLSCPFCGEISARIATSHFLSEPVSKEEYFIECYYCKAKTGPYDSISGAINSWNKRASFTVLPYNGTP